MPIEATIAKRRGRKPVPREHRASEVVVIRLTPREKARIRAAKDADGVGTLVETIRDAIDEYCDRREIEAA